MQFYALTFCALFLMSCSGTKKVSSVSQTTTNAKNQYFKKKQRVLSKETNLYSSQELSEKVNRIILTYTDTELSQIARSKVEETANGYSWKFTNVSTGQSYTVQTDYSFKEIEISKATSLSEL